MGQLEGYQQAAQIADQLLGLSIHASQIYRLTNHNGAAIDADLDQALVPDQPVAGLVYAQADGAMLLTDEGYKENKPGRIFQATALKASAAEERGGQIESSLFTAHLGSATDFVGKLRVHLDGYKGLGSDLVFISDGAVWLRQMMQTYYPQATLILDLYHAMSTVGQVGMAAFSHKYRAQNWIDQQHTLLLDSQLDKVLTHSEALAVPTDLRDSVCGYLSTNRDRMDYKAYRQRGLLIGSGAIESAPGTVVQKRLKRAGQRWTQAAGQRVLNLQVCWMSGRWALLRKHIEPYSYAMAA